MIKCIIHCSDIHIRNFQRLNEYAEQLTNFVEKCKEIAKDYERDEIRIVICGDLVHQKNNISNELMTFSSFFLRQLEEIAKVIVVAGNHDLLVNNMSRTDTLTALFDTANFDDCMFIDSVLGFESGFVEDDNVVWALYSIYDHYSNPLKENDRIQFNDKQIVGLFHGHCIGATLNNGTVVDEGLSKNSFKLCDCVMAGHIHKRQTITIGNCTFIYSGSLIQQDKGETITQHGYVLWELKDGKFVPRFVDLDNDYGIYKFEISNENDIINDKEILLNY